MNENCVCGHHWTKHGDVVTNDHPNPCSEEGCSCKNYEDVPSIQCQWAIHSGFVRHESEAAIEVEPPEEIKDLLWDEVPETDEHNDPVSNHNTLVLAGFIRGKEVGAGRGYNV